MGKRDDEVKRHRQIHETNEWVEAKKGQRFAPGTYVDGSGVLRAVSDGSVVTWHARPRIRAAFGLTGSCERRGITPGEVVYDPETGAPWCPECWPVELKRRAAEEKAAKEMIKDAKEGIIKLLFGKNQES